MKISLSQITSSGSGLAESKTLTPIDSRRKFLSFLWSCSSVLAVYSIALSSKSLLAQTNKKEAAPDDASVESRVRKVVVEQLGVKPEQVTLSARYTEDLGADSLDVVELVMAFEEAFDIEIPDDDAEKIHTVQDSVTYIEKRTAAKK